ncbi:unnamed protein product [Trichobilharzia szidati]|nr:unnamed protein product [Trichobilharzia szidati]
MIKKHCLVLPLAWTLFQLSYVLCNKLSPVQNNELATRIKHYAELYGYYKTAEFIRDIKKQIYVKHALEYLNKLKMDSNWKNVKYLSEPYEDHPSFSETFEEYHHRNAAKEIASKLRDKKSKIDLTTVFNNFTKSLDNAWAARKDLYTTAAVNFATANKLENPETINENNVERKCFQMSGMQLDRNAVDEFLTKSNSTNEKISEFKNAVVQMISEVQKVEKFRIDKYPNRNVAKEIVSELVNKKSKIDLTTVFNNFTKSLDNAWAARKDLYTTAAVNFATANKLENPETINESVLLAEEDLQVSMEEEFVQSRDNVERKCFQMSGMQLDRNAVDEFLTKSNSTNEKISEFKNAVVQMISEVQRLEKFRIDRFPTYNTMYRELLHEFGRKDK